MAPITVNSWISFFVIGFYIAAALFIIAYIVVKGKQNAERMNEDRYNDLYTLIQDKIMLYEKTESHRIYIEILLQTLESLSYKNEEKTRALWDNFNKEFNKKS
jgi:hypothetical protein